MATNQSNKTTSRNYNPSEMYNVTNFTTAGEVCVGSGAPVGVPKIGESYLYQDETNGQLFTWIGSSWTAIAGSAGTVTTVFGRAGAVVAVAGDYDATLVSHPIPGPVNYSAAFATVAGHLAGIDTALGGTIATNLGYTPAATTGTITSSTGSGTTIPAASAVAGGLLSASDKGKLDTIEPSAKDDQLASEVPVAFTATDYAPATADVEAHLVAINTALAAIGPKSKTNVVGTIAARDALAGVLIGDSAYVADASSDATVTSGAAFYVYDGAVWFKFAEFESLDLVQSATNTSFVATGNITAIDVQAALAELDTEKQAIVTTTQGDIIVGDATGDAVRLAIGPAATVLTSDGTTVSWSAPSNPIEVVADAAARGVYEATIGVAEEGQLIYQQDTDVLYTWDGATSNPVGASNNRVFADDTAVSPATAGTPTIAEITTFTAANTVTDTIVYYTGNDTSTDVPTYVYHSDKSGTVTLIESPSGSANDRLFADDTTVAPASAGAPTEAEIATFAGVNFDRIIYYTGTDTSTDTPTYVFDIDASGNVTTLESASTGLGTTLSRIQVSLTTTKNNAGGTQYEFDSNLFTQGGDLSLNAAGNIGAIAGLQAGKTYKLSWDGAIDPPSGAAATVFRFVDLTASAQIGREWEVISEQGAVPESGQSSASAFFTPGVVTEVGVDFVSGAAGEMSALSTFTVEEVPSTSVVSAGDLPITGGTGTLGQSLQSNGDGTATFQNSSGITPDWMTAAPVSGGTAISENGGFRPDFGTVFSSAPGTGLIQIGGKITLEANSTYVITGSIRLDTGVSAPTTIYDYTNGVNLSPPFLVNSGQPVSGIGETIVQTTTAIQVNFNFGSAVAYPVNAVGYPWMTVRKIA